MHGYVYSFAEFKLCGKNKNSEIFNDFQESQLPNIIGNDTKNFII